MPNIKRTPGRRPGDRSEAPITPEEKRVISMHVGGSTKVDAWRSLGRKRTCSKDETSAADDWFRYPRRAAYLSRLMKKAHAVADRSVKGGVMSRAEALVMLTGAARRTNKMIHGTGKGGDGVTEVDNGASDKTIPGLVMSLVSIIDRLSKLEDWDKQKPAGINVAVFMDLRGASPEARRSRLRQLTTGTGALTEGDDAADEAEGEILDLEAE